MQDKQPDKNESAGKEADQNTENQDVQNQDDSQEAGQKIGLKSRKTGKNGEGADADWKKVESIMSAAKDAYDSGRSGFKDVVESLIATLQDLLASEDGSSDLGGLYGGPQMDIPAGPDEQPEGEVPAEEKQ